MNVYHARIFEGSTSDGAKTNKVLAVLKKIGVTYGVSIASCHRNMDGLPDFVESIHEKIIVFIGSMSLAAPGVIRAILTAAKRADCVVMGIPLDEAARSALEDLPPGVPVIACGLNTSDVNAGLVNAALNIGHIVAMTQSSVKQGLLDWYEENKKKKPLVSSVKLVDGLIPIEEKK
jgi:phosphoribosylcarboxyaminoimidazole (NCAIR) mutase